ncbi:hypothetical protein ACF3DV_24915 [Chlorogloeopsis fritschii PCC 9212]|uniref:Uncharacterized protein n=1 Tax=Chlorogloeopsis fritschii PCC 6912 TaxID=211165 RepID=A0A433NPE1_CHLFR|nr:hypothetical protein [Chlorogloeopsis fritschii]RUR85701.1 hypothetical protein PCC6912_05260 [Chlorogloeopsis fritschii PCC 6912]
MTESITDLRGVGSFNYNGTTVLCRSDVYSVAHVISDMRGAKTWRRNVVGQKIELTDQCFIIFRLRSHQWTQVIGRDRAAFNLLRSSNLDTEQTVKKMREAEQSIHLNEDDAEILSGLLDTYSIFYQVSDTANALRYKLYFNGKLLEKFKADDWYDVPELESYFRTVNIDNIGDVREWVDRFFKEQNVYIPGWKFTDFAGYFCHKPGDKILIEDPDRDFERLDFINL